MQVPPGGGRISVIILAVQIVYIEPHYYAVDRGTGVAMIRAEDKPERGVLVNFMRGSTAQKPGTVVPICWEMIHDYCRGLGEIPTHWDLAKLKHAAAFSSGGTPSKSVAEYWDGDVPWASSKDLKTETLSDTTDHITPTAVIDGASLIDPGALLVVVRGMILARDFPVAKTMVPMAINQDLKAIRPFDEWNVDYFANLLRASSGETFRRLDEAGHGTKALRMEAWTGMQLPRPPKAEQVVIGAFLDRETAKIDALVAEQERLVELLKEKRQAVISRAVTKGLEPDAPMKDSGIEWLGEIPAHWSMKRLKNVAASIEQGWSPQCESYPADLEHEWGVLKVGCVNSGELDPTENKTLPAELDPDPSLAINEGDVLISRANTRELVGRAACARESFPHLLLCDKLYRVRLLDTCTPAYLVRFLSSAAVRGQIELSATGASSSMQNIGQATILGMPMPLPPIQEQALIIEYLRCATRSLISLSAEAEQAIALLRERRSALITAAVTGQIDVRGVAPEPA